MIAQWRIDLVNDVDASKVFEYERKKQAIYLGNYTRDHEGLIRIGQAA